MEVQVTAAYTWYEGRGQKDRTFLDGMKAIDKVSVGVRLGGPAYIKLPGSVNACPIPMPMRLSPFPLPFK